MKLPLFIVDSFTSKSFGGNPAAVVVLDRWLPSQLLQEIAAENNQSETAFVAARSEGYEIRWFTPKVEIDLCGHATLAAGYVLFNHAGAASPVTFHSKSGVLTIERAGEDLILTFPSRPAVKSGDTDLLTQALGRKPLELYKSRDYLAVFEDEATVREIAPDMARIAALDALGVIVTAPGTDVDFVSRFFAPGAGIPEDPVTGSAHTTLTPYWAGKLGRESLSARQLSARGGELRCVLENDAVKISGRVTPYLEGHIQIAA